MNRYYGKPVEFVMHGNGELGQERDYLNFMSQGISVDYAIVSPSHMGGYARSAPLMDAPFLFRDRSHWSRVMQSAALKPIADEVEKRADVRILGYAGGGERHIIAIRAMPSLAQLKGMKLRVPGSPVVTRAFAALGTNPTVVAYPEVYNAIQSGVVDGLENEASAIEQAKFYEVAPHLMKTGHAITVRPLVFSGKSLKRLPPDLQAAILRAGAEAAAFGRNLESEEDGQRLSQLVARNGLKTYEVADRPRMFELATPVLQEFAKDIGAESVLSGIQAIK